MNDAESPLWPVNFTEQRVTEDKNVIELEGKTKNLVAGLWVNTGDGPQELTLIPAFQGIWMRVRITVELVPSEETP